MAAAVANSVVVVIATAVVLGECFGHGRRAGQSWGDVLRRRVKDSPRAAALVGAVAAAALVLGIVWGLTRDLPLPFSFRVLVVLLGLAAIVVADVRHGIVPYLYLGVLVGVRIALYLWEGIAEPAAMLAVLRGEVLTASLIVVVLGVVRLTQRGGLGWGDIWILALLPLFLGPRLALMSILAAFVAAFGYSLWALLSRRKRRKDAFPLAPAILGGVLVVLVYTTVRGLAA